MAGTSEVDAIERIRHKNNVLWMDILRIALERAPHEAKEILKKINENDRLISELLGTIAHSETNE